MKKLISILVAFAMMAALAVTTAFAADPAPTGTADSAKLVKYLDLDDGVVANNSLVFNFTFTNEANAQDVVTTSILITGAAGNGYHCECCEEEGNLFHLSWILVFIVIHYFIYYKWV